MTKTESHFRRVLSKIDARRFPNQQKCINCVKPRSNKNERECKKCGCNKFCASEIIDDFYS